MYFNISSANIMYRTMTPQVLANSQANKCVSKTNGLTSKIWEYNLNGYMLSVCLFVCFFNL